MVSGADPPVVPIADKVSPDEGFQFFYRKTVCNIPSIEEFDLHSRPHTFTTGIVVAAPSGAVHALADVVSGVGFAISFTRILRSTVRMDNGSLYIGICHHCIRQRPFTQGCFHAGIHCQTKNSGIVTVKDCRNIEPAVPGFDFSDVRHALF